MLYSRGIVEKDYEQLCEWWREWGWEHPMPQHLLGQGVMICDDEVNICAGFLYTLKEAPIAWFTFPISNPNVRGDIRKYAIQLLIQNMTEKAKESGAQLMYSALRNISMIEAQKEAGFVANGGYTELIKII
jgi:hypothetical protein